MTAALPMGTNKITGMADPTLATDGATKNYVDTAISTNISLPIPQGYLTPTSNTPIIATDVISSTNVFYTFKEGGWLPLFNGTTFIPYLMPSQFQLALTSSQAANNIYDIFLAYNANVPVIGTGPSWAAGTGGSVAAGSCARGTGVGGTALTRLSGFSVNAASMSLIWNTGSGNTTITVGANQGLYLGTIFIDSVAGQVTCHRSWGQARKWAVWNAYNRVPLIVKCGDGPGNWTYNSATPRAANGNASNSITVFSGLAEEQYRLLYEMNLTVQSIVAGVTYANKVGIGYNVTNAVSGRAPLVQYTTDSGNTSLGSSQTEAIASFIAPPSLGINTVTALDIGTATNSWTYQSTELNMVLSAEWRA